MNRYLVNILKHDEDDLTWNVIDNDEMPLPSFSQPTGVLENAVQEATQGHFMDRDDKMSDGCIESAVSNIVADVEDLEQKFENMVDDIIRGELDDCYVEIDDLMSHKWCNVNFECSNRNLEQDIREDRKSVV